KPGWHRPFLDECLALARKPLHNQQTSSALSMTNTHPPQSSSDLMMLSGKCLFASALFLFAAATASADEPAKLVLQKGDRISIIGNTLADRMQHDGWLETYFHARFPKHDLTFRNLGFSGDELTLRLRSAGFGSPDDWLTRTKADVVFAFFG